MAQENDVLNPDPGALVDNGGFGLRLFKSKADAMREDVAPRAFGSEPSQPQGPRTIADMMGVGAGLGGAPALSIGSSSTSKAAPKSGRSVADLMGMGASTFDEEEEAPKDQGNFSRGFAVSGKQLKQTAYGTAALIGDTIGATGVKEWGLKGFKDAEKEVQAISKESDSFTNAMQSGELGKWFTYSSGYLLGQVAELGVASLAGAALGSAAAPGAGTAAGAVAGAIEKGAVQSGVKGMIAKMIDKEATRLVGTGMAEKAAAEAAMTSVYRTIGATTANTFLNATQELGSIYGDAVEEAAKTGKEYSLGKVWLSGVMATAVDSWADSKAVGKMMDAFKGGKGIGGVAVEAFKGGFREGMTEGVQTAIERWGADKDLTSKEAFKEYIDSAAVGVLGGSISGGSAAGVKRMLEPGEPVPGKSDQNQQTSGFGETGVTTLPGDKTGRAAVQPDELVMPQAQFRDALANVGYVASIYQDADQAQKQKIDMAIDRAGLRAEFDAAFKDGEAMANGQKLLTENPEERGLFMSALDKYATTMPRPGNFKTAPPAPVSEQQRLDEISQANEQQYGPAVNKDPLKSAKEDFANFDPIDNIDDKEFGPYSGAEQTDDGFWLSRDGKYTVIPAGRYSIHVVPLDVARFVKKNGFGVSHLNIESARAYEMAKEGKDPGELREFMISELAPEYSSMPEEQQKELSDWVDNVLNAARKEFNLPLQETAEAQQVSQATAEPAQVTQDQKDLATVLSQKNKARNKPELKPEDIEIVPLPQAIADIGNMFGIELVGFKAKGGVTTKGMSSRSTNKIYINAATQGNVDMRFILGHEVWHQLERRNPEMAALLADEVVAYVKSTRREAYAKQITALGYSPEKVSSEMAGDILGILFT